MTMTILIKRRTNLTKKSPNAPTSLTIPKTVKMKKTAKKTRVKPMMKSVNCCVSV